MSTTTDKPVSITGGLLAIIVLSIVAAVAKAAELLERRR